MTRGGAGFANSEMMLAGGKWDTFRMLTHPGTAIIPAALVAAETEGASGRDFITGVAAGYEVMERMAADWIPTVMARGFHAGPVFSIFGAAVAAAKIMRFTDDQVHATISLCTNLAGSNLESRALREGAAVRNAMLAVALAKQGKVGGGEAVLEGPAGFYHAYAGNNHGPAHLQLRRRHANQPRQAHRRSRHGLDVPRDAVPDLLDSRLQHRARRRHGEAVRRARHQVQDVDRVEAVVNWLETQYPSPAFPHAAGRHRRADARQHAVLHGIRRRQARFPDAARARPIRRRCSSLMKRVTIIPSHQMTLFGPRITIFTKDGRSYTKQATGREFIWDFDEEARRIRAVVPGIPISGSQFERVIATCRDLDRQDRADALVRLTLK